ncbi:ABC transporter substrate-binding protein [Pseudoroseicyclus sp. H15]
MALIRFAIFCIVLFLPIAGQAQDDPLSEVVIGHISLADDPRYQQNWGYARLIVPPPVRTIEGAEMAVDDLAFVSQSMGLAPRIEAREVAPDGVVPTLQELVDMGALFVLLDLPADLVEQAAEAGEGMAVTLINVSANDNALRTACHAGLLHSAPSDRMLMDAFAQFLRAKDWTRVLMLVGENPQDAVTADAFEDSAARLRLTIEERRDFTLAADPASREGNNIALLTSGARYDVVFIADDRGEFARYVPYATQDARPVIGATGLTAESWHWAMERDGATQVSSRFDKAYGRRMSSADWSAWVAVKSVLQAYTRAPEQTVESMTSYMASDDMALDGSKGVQLNYRPWDGQLRMPILLATSDAVIVVAPVEGYLHATNVLDTLGMDEAEFACN